MMMISDFGFRISDWAKVLAVASLLALTGLASAGVSVRVEGDGYLRFLQDGRAVYAKSATLSVLNGELKEKSGASLLPTIRISSTQVTVNEAGWVVLGSSKIARLILAKFPADLEPSGNFLVARDRPTLGYAESEGFGKIISIDDKRETNNDKGIDISARNAAKPQGRNTGVLESKIQNPKPKTENALTPQRHDVIKIGASATVGGPHFTLGEIAEVTGPEADRIKTIDLGNAPVHGVPLTYTRERILAKITLLNIDRKSFDLEMGNAIEIRREGLSISPDQLLTKAKEAVASKSGLKGELTSADRLTEIQIPKGEIELSAESVSIGNGTATVTIGIRVDGKRFTGRTIRLTGAALEVAIQSGASITVRFVSNGLSVEMPGRAKTGGAIGQTIEVLVSGDGTTPTTHQGIIKAPGIVEVAA